VRAAAFNWLLARRHGGEFLLRIEDTDTERNVAGGEEAIAEDLRWLGLDWDEGPDIGGPHGPYRQSERDDIYAQALRRLLESGHGYPCFCSQEDLSEEAEDHGEGRTAQRYSGKCRVLDPEEASRRVASGEPHVIRFAVPEGLASIEVKDEIFGSITTPTSDIDDFVLRRTDGRVTYNFAVVVDDVDMRITHVVRGVGHLSNTPKQALLFDALGARRPAFAHLPTVLGDDGRKLSKRQGAAAVADLRAQGFPADAVLNYLSLLGWSHPEEREVLTREELVAAISLDRVGRSDTQLDAEKLRWVSSQHLAKESLADLASHVRPFVSSARYPAASSNLEGAVDTLRTRLATYGDIDEHLGLLYPEASVTGPRRAELGRNSEARKVLSSVREALADSEQWTAEALDKTVRAAGAAVDAKGAALFHPVREVLIGSEKGPDLGKILVAVGREDALSRFDEALG
jgi:glutamyl-tRNA synthetase